MKRNHTQGENSSPKAICGTILLAVSLMGFDVPANAENSLSASNQGLLEQSQGLNPDQETLLPPPVVPVDLKATSKHADASTKELDLEVNKSFSAQNSQPKANMNMHPATSGVTTARDRRSAIMNSLMQPGTISPVTSQNDFQILSNGSQSANPALSSQLPLRQPDWLAPQSQSVRANGYVSQTQTLTASARSPIVRRDIRKGGVANNVAGAMTIGTGLFTGTLNRPNSLMGLGITGLLMTGFGRRQ